MYNNVQQLVFASEAATETVFQNICSSEGPFVPRTGT